MGVAIIIPGVVFTENLGKVTLVDGGGSGGGDVDVKVESIAISGLATVNTSSNKATYSVDYTPTNTTQKGVTWSLESGEEYATIDSLGTLTVKGSGSVTIKAVSKHNTAVTAKKVVSVVFNEVHESDEYTELEYVGTKGGNYLQTNTIMAAGQKIILKAKLPIANNQSTVARQFILHDGSSCSMGNTYKDKIFSVTLPFRSARTTAVVNGVVEFTISAYSCDFTVDGSAATITPSDIKKSSTTPVMLFSNNNNSFVHERVDLYSFRLEKDGSAVIELKPVLKDGVPCFRDTVSGKFLYITGSNSIYYATKTEPNNELTYNG